MVPPAHPLLLPALFVTDIRCIPVHSALSGIQRGLLSPGTILPCALPPSVQVLRYAMFSTGIGYGVYRPIQYPVPA
eukprot:1770748-Rhodomonas_salina.1